MNWLRRLWALLKPAEPAPLPDWPTLRNPVVMDGKPVREPAPPGAAEEP